MNFITTIKRLGKRFWIPLATALIVGLIYGLPYIAFIVQLGHNYHGIPMMLTGDEETYIARIHDIVDGHGLLGSPVLWEYKNQLPTMPPTGEWLYALPVLLFGFSVIDVLIASRFILPAVLTILVYWWTLTFFDDRTVTKRLLAAGTSFVVLLGYDFVDVAHIASLMQGRSLPTAFLIWARPVNPILGAIALFSMLIALNVLVRQKKKSKAPLIVGSCALAFMFGSYFFSWGMAVTVLLSLIGLLILTKQRSLAIRITKMLMLGVVLAAPYWYMLIRLMQSQSYSQGAGSSGFFMTHDFIFNKFSFFSALLMLGVVVVQYLHGGKERIRAPRVLFTIACIMASLIVFDQQIVTGRVVWPFHFVQYTIPILMTMIVILITQLINMMRSQRVRQLFISCFIFIISAVSLTYAVYVQARVYESWVPYTAAQQQFAALFSWIDMHTYPDCVVLVREGDDGTINGLLPGFTHCNVYTSNYRVFNIPDPLTRFEHNYMVLLRLQGVTPAAAEDYMRSHERTARSLLGMNYQDYFDKQYFTDVPKRDFDAYFHLLSTSYATFYAQDFREELLKYRIDLIVAESPLDPMVAHTIKGLVPIGEIGGSSVYTIK